MSAKPQMRSLLIKVGIPVLAAGSVVGLLECSRRDRAPWSRLQLRHARIIATVLGPVMATLSR